MSEKRILIVEDNGAFRIILSFDLIKKGFKTLMAEDGEKGYEMAVREKPDLIILDVMMPKMSGIEVCRRLKALEETKHIPVVILSASSQSKTVFEGLSAGASKYIVKPAQFTDVYNVIVKLIGEPTPDTPKNL